MSGSRFGDCLHQGEGMRRPGENGEQWSPLGVEAGRRKRLHAIADMYCGPSF